MIKNPETQEPKIIEDRGYSFCNCKNIWYTDWSNMDFRVYDSDYVTKYNSKATEVLFKHSCDIHFPILKEHNTNIKHFIDIGALHTGVLDYANKEGWRTTALDFNDSINNGIHNRIIGNIEYPDVVKRMKDVDVVWMSHVMEHLEHPLETVKNIYNQLNPKGLFYVAMPDPFFIDWVDSFRWGHWALREHHIMWDLQSFIKECEVIGFKLIYKNRNMLTNYICVRDFQVILQK